MNILVAYDVSTVSSEGRRRLRRVAKICEGFGQRVQYSLFEVTCSNTQFARLLIALEGAIEPREDSLRIYPIDRDTLSDVIQIGRTMAFEAHEPWNL